MCPVKNLDTEMCGVFGNHAGTRQPATQQEYVPARRHALQSATKRGQQFLGQDRVILHNQVTLTWICGGVVQNVQPNAHVAKSTSNGPFLGQSGMSTAKPSTFDLG